MASTNDYLEYILDLFKDLDDISYKKMMGEYILYINGKIFGGIYDNRLLIKKDILPDYLNLDEEIPYPSAKPMYFIDTDNKEVLNNIIEIISKLLEK